MRFGFSAYSFLVLFLWISISGITYHQFKKNQIEDARMNFDDKAKETSIILKTKIEIKRDDTRGIEYLFKASGKVEENELKAYTANLFKKGVFDTVCFYDDNGDLFSIQSSPSTYCQDKKGQQFIGEFYNKKTNSLIENFRVISLKNQTGIISVKFHLTDLITESLADYRLKFSFLTAKELNQLSKSNNDQLSYTSREALFFNGSEKIYIQLQAKINDFIKEENSTSYYLIIALFAFISGFIIYVIESFLDREQLIKTKVDKATKIIEENQKEMIRNLELKTFSQKARLIIQKDKSIEEKLQTIFQSIISLRTLNIQSQIAFFRSLDDGSLELLFENNFEGSSHFKINSYNRLQSFIENYQNIYFAPIGEEKPFGFFLYYSESIHQESNNLMLKEICSITQELIQNSQKNEELNNQKKIAHHQSRLASIGQMAAGVGHEINNPLTIIGGYIGKVRRLVNESTIDKDEIHYTLEKILIASNRISAIVKGLRNFSRSDQGTEEAFDIIEVINETLFLITEIYAHDSISIQVTGVSEHPSLKVWGNRGKIQQVILNLLSNAKDAVENVEKPQLNLNLEVDNNENIIISVVDNGMGIPSQVQSKIFDPFFTTKGVNEGTGIGLALSHSILQEYGGSIRFETQEGKGTTFFIQFPRQLEKIQKTVPIISPNQEKDINIQKQNLNILVVDDEKEIQSLLMDMLKLQSGQIITANNGQEALDLIRKQKIDFDLIISDIKMPIMNGASLLRKLRLEENIQTPFILSTGGVAIDLEDKSLEVNQLADGFIYKPYVEKDIHKVIQNVMESSTRSKTA